MRVNHLQTMPHPCKILGSAPTGDCLKKHSFWDTPGTKSYCLTKTFQAMVTIVDYVQRENSDGDEFFALIVEGGLEIIQSKESGNHYFTAKKASVPSTFNEESCKKLIGRQLRGSVERLECEPYDFKIPKTDEVIKLNFSWKYSPEAVSVEEHVYDEEVKQEVA